MIPKDEWMEVVNRVRSLWGNSPKWRKPAEVYRMASDLDVGHLDMAIEYYFFTTRSTAPSPSEVVTKAREYRGSRRLLSLECQHPVYGIIEDAEVQGHMMRVAVCAVCGWERTVTPKTIMTDYEREQGEPTIRPQVPDQRTDDGGRQPGTPGVGDLGDLDFSGYLSADPGDLPGSGLRDGTDGEPTGADPAADPEKDPGRVDHLPDPERPVDLPDPM